MDYLTGLSKTRQAASSLLHRSELRAVFVLDGNDHPRLRQVRTGVHNANLVEILAGLSEGERIVADPLQLSGQPALSVSEESRP